MVKRMVMVVSMVVSGLVVPALGLGACAQQTSSTPLAKLSTSTLEVVARGQLNVELHVDESDGCPTLGDDTVARFDGQPMQISRGGYDVNASGCYPIAFWFDELPTAAINGYESAGVASELIVADHSKMWTLDTSRLFANNFVNDAAAATITWLDVDQITSARLDKPVTSIAGNVIHYAPGTTVTEVDAVAHPATTRCDGPSVCTVSLEGYHSWLSNP